jgi:type VI secretion system protein ImpA
MTHQIDIEAILSPFSEDNPAGENLRYSPTYDAVKEARRADDLLDRGDWQRDLKTSDWDQVVALTNEALREKSKDLQLAVWMTEGLIHTDGFSGLVAGLQVINGMLERFWDSFYPLVEDDDIEYRVGPLQFLNEKVWLAIKGIPLTDPSQTPGYDWIKWQESRKVGYEDDAADDRRKNERQELIEEGKLSAEDFDLAVAKSSKEFYRRLAEVVSQCLEEGTRLDNLVDEKFGAEGPSLVDFKTAIEDCHTLAAKIFKEKLVQEPDEELPSESPEPEEQLPPVQKDADVSVSAVTEPPAQDKSRESSMQEGAVPDVGFFAQSEGREQSLWEEAKRVLKGGDIKTALEQLFLASCTATSVREKNRYRLLIAKLCLKAERADLARPILEELYTLTDELQLDRWESPVWIAEVIEALYQCLTSERYAEEDPDRAGGLLTRLCTMDVTKAMVYKN